MNFRIRRICGQNAAERHHKAVFFVFLACHGVSRGCGRRRIVYVVNVFFPCGIYLILYPEYPVYPCEYIFLAVAPQGDVVRILNYVRCVRNAS